MTATAVVAAATTTTVIGVHAAVGDRDRSSNARPATAAAVSADVLQPGAPTGAERSALDRRQARAEARERAARTARQARKTQAASERASRSTRVQQVDGIRGVAAQLAASRYGWGADQFACLEPLWERESGWDASATNPSSGAYGIPQALPGSKMASAGADWRTNPVTQVEWGLGYIDGRYGSPCAAYDSLQTKGWY